MLRLTRLRLLQLRPVHRHRRRPLTMSAIPRSLQGTIKFKYLDLGQMGGRGGVVRNMLLIHGIDYDEISIPPGDSWLKAKEELIASGDNPVGKVPVLYINDRIYFGHVPILKYLAAQVQTLPVDPELAYLSEVVLDEYKDWRNEWATGFRDPAVKKAYLSKRLNYYALTEKLYDRRPDKDSPFFTAQTKPGYEDLCVAGLMFDDQLVHGEVDMDSYPTLKTLLQKVNAIPQIAEWRKQAAAK